MRWLVAGINCRGSAVAHLALGNVRQPVRSLVFGTVLAHAHILVDRTGVFLAALGAPLPRHVVRHAEARLQSAVKPPPQQQQQQQRHRDFTCHTTAGRVVPREFRSWSGRSRQGGLGAGCLAACLLLLARLAHGLHAARLHCAWMQASALPAPPIFWPVCRPEVSPSLLAVCAQPVTLVDGARMLFRAATAPLPFPPVSVAEACLFHQTVLAVLLRLPPDCPSACHRGS